jgi:hypothetical protein
MSIFGGSGYPLLLRAPTLATVTWDLIYGYPSTCGIRLSTYLISLVAARARSIPINSHYSHQVVDVGWAYRLGASRLLGPWIEQNLVPLMRNILRMSLAVTIGSIRGSRNRGHPVLLEK